MTRKKALDIMAKVQRIEQLEMQLEQLEHWANNETTGDLIDRKEFPYPSYLRYPMFEESDIDDLIAVVEPKLQKALKELEEL